MNQREAESTIWTMQVEHQKRLNELALAKAEAELDKAVSEAQLARVCLAHGCQQAEVPVPPRPKPGGMTPGELRAFLGAKWKDGSRG